jgi:hypothetical protein
VKPRRISNQSTYKPRSYKFSSHSHILPPSIYVCRPESVSVRKTRFSRDRHLGTEGVLHKIRNISWIHRSLEHKVITNQVHNEIAEANSFKATHTFSSYTVSGDSHFQQKHHIRYTERPLPLVLVVAHRRIQAVDAIPVIHLTICNNNGNNTLSTRKYSVRLTRLKLK